MRDSILKVKSILILVVMAVLGAGCLQVSGEELDHSTSASSRYPGGDGSTEPRSCTSHADCAGGTSVSCSGSTGCKGTDFVGCQAFITTGWNEDGSESGYVKVTCCDGTSNCRP